MAAPVYSNVTYPSTPVYQASLPATTQPIQVPQYQSVVAQQSAYVMPTTQTQSVVAQQPAYVMPTTQVIQTGLPSSQSMIAYPGVSAMDGPFKFTAGATA